MDVQKLHDLIDKAIGKKGPLHMPAWWLWKIFDLLLASLQSSISQIEKILATNDERISSNTVWLNSLNAEVAAQRNDLNTFGNQIAKKRPLGYIIIYNGAIGGYASGDSSGVYLNPGQVVRVSFSKKFSTCYYADKIDCRFVDTSQVTDMSGFFNGQGYVEDLDLSSFDTLSVTNMSSFLSGSRMLKNLNIEGFYTNEVKDMSNMFMGCSSLESLDLSHFYTPKLQYCSSMFQGCSKLRFLNLFNFDTTSLWSSIDMFRGCLNMESLILGPDFFKVTRQAVWNNNKNYLDLASMKKWTNETVVSSLITDSYDRTSNNLHPIYVNLSDETLAVLTEEQIQQAAAKGINLF